MKVFLFFLLAGCAVKCSEEDNNYYIVNMPQEDQRSSPILVYWNIPTMQCASKKVYFGDLYEKYGIIQNKDDRFRGEKITIMYDPGFFPAIINNTTSNEYRLRNGGVPQEGNYDEHAKKFSKDINDQIPDINFNGIAVIDFESWRPVFRQNWGTLDPYRNISYELERQKHWWWPKNLLEGVARARFEKAGRIFMQNTIALAKELRAKAHWGYYAYPYCYNMKTSVCSDETMMDNDRIDWLWTESTALYPSIYSSKSLSTNQLVAMVAGRIREAARVSKNSHILPYFWYRYRDGGFMEKRDLDAVLRTIYESPASGLIAWGSSYDVNTVEKCQDLLNYLTTTLGPTIAQYTKRNIPKETPIKGSSHKDSLSVENDNKVSANKSSITVSPIKESSNITSIVSDSAINIEKEGNASNQQNNQIIRGEPERVDFDKVIQIFESLNNDTPIAQLDNDTLDHEPDMTDLLITFMKSAICDCSNCNCKGKTSLQEPVPTTTQSTTLPPTTTEKTTTLTEQDFITVIEVATEKPHKCHQDKATEKITESTTPGDTSTQPLESYYEDNLVILEALRQKTLCNSRLFEKIIHALPITDATTACSREKVTTESFPDSSSDTETEPNSGKLYKEGCFDKENDYREDIPNLVANKNRDQVIRLLLSVENEDNVTSYY